jgi:glycosyltransferase involved in cell wall biosynthesis
VSTAELTPSAVRAASGSKPLDVLAVIDHFALGGAEMMLGQFAAAASKAQIDLRVACLEERDGNPAAEPLRAIGIEPVCLDIGGRPGARHVEVMRRHIRAVRPAIVHTHLGGADIVGGVAGRSLGLPTVSTIHEVIKRQRGLQPRAKSELYMLTRRLCAARVIAVSDSARRAYLEQSRRMGERVVRIYNGIGVTPQPGSGAELRRELGVEQDAPLVGMVSALRPEKAHDVAIEAVAALRERFPKLRLLIAGGGGYAAEVERLAAPLGETVQLIGPRKDVMRVFDALDVCLHPSRMDAFPTTLIEALAASTPIVASSVGGIPEIVEDGVSGVLVPSPATAATVAEALGALLADAPRRQALAKAGREAYEQRFTAERWVKTTRGLYDEVLAQRREPRWRAR